MNLQLGADPCLKVFHFFFKGAGIPRAPKKTKTTKEANEAAGEADMEAAMDEEEYEDLEEEDDESEIEDQFVDRMTFINDL